jgi:hypothetical protein
MEISTLAKLLSRKESVHVRTLKSVKIRERRLSDDARKLKRVRGFKGPTKYKLERIRSIKKRHVKYKKELRVLRKRFKSERIYIIRLKKEWKKRTKKTEKVVSVIKWDVLAVETDEKGIWLSSPVWNAGNMAVEGIRDFHDLFYASDGGNIEIFKGTKYGHWKILDASGRFYIYFKEDGKRYYSVDHYFDPTKV